MKKTKEIEKMENTIEEIHDAESSVMTARDDNIALLKKVYNAHKIMSEMEWPKDGYNQGQSYRYRTEGLLKRNFQRALLDAGLIYKLDIADVIQMPAVGAMSTHLRAHGYLTLIDCDTGAGLSYNIISEAADSGDKTAAKLMTMALKSAISTEFAVSSDDDPDGDVRVSPTTQAERNEALNKMRAERAQKARKAQKAQKAPAKPVERLQPNPNDAVKEETVAPSHQEPAPKAEKPAKTTVKAESKTVPAETDDEAPTAIQVKTMANMLGRAETKGDPDILAEMTKTHESIKTKAESAIWIKKYREAIK